MDISNKFIHLICISIASNVCSLPYKSFKTIEPTSATAWVGSGICISNWVPNKLELVGIVQKYDNCFSYDLTW